MDGVLYVGNRALPGVRELLAYLDSTGRSFLCVTNNAAMTPIDFSAKLERMGVKVPPERILGSAEATAVWLANHAPRQPSGKRANVLVNGMHGLRTALEAQDFVLTRDPLDAEYVVSGINFDLTYEDLMLASLAIRNGAQFIGTNPDLSVPIERGVAPGAGALLAAIEAATGVKPHIIGKPFAPMYELAMERLGVSPAQTMMVGDRYDTDIAGAQALGLATACVLTGISSEEEFRSATPPPTLIAAGLPELLSQLIAADEQAHHTH